MRLLSGACEHWQLWSMEETWWGGRGRSGWSEAPRSVCRKETGLDGFPDPESADNRAQVCENVYVCVLFSPRILAVSTIPVDAEWNLLQTMRWPWREDRHAFDPSLWQARRPICWK
jgi:hypothetical protein